MTTEERRDSAPITIERTKERRNELHQIDRTIIESLGHQPSTFEEHDWNKLTEEYLSRL
jgi:hypothetical protein